MVNPTSGVNTIALVLVCLLEALNIVRPDVSSHSKCQFGNSFLAPHMLAEFRAERGLISATGTVGLYPPGLFRELMDEIWSTQKGKERLEDWMEGVNRSIEHAMLPRHWLRVLDSATHSDLRNKKDIETVIIDRFSACTLDLISQFPAQNLVSAQVLHMRSQSASQVQHGLEAFAWATGASQQLIKVIGSCELSKSYTII
ncbi:hypothetical protein C8J56DRAFT_891587 [Mycena floridula]|nr:hypothetical protein C8J56DRAFT_891587 [Mycena floridula]